MHVVHPFYLLGLLVCLGFYGLLCKRRSGACCRLDLPLALRCAVISLLCLSLSGVHVMWGEQEATVIFVLDVSESIAPADKTAALEYIQRLRQTLPARMSTGLVIFGKAPAIEQAVGLHQTPSVLQARPDATGTDIAQALHLAIAMPGSSAHKRLVLLSDGNETVGEARRAAALAAARGIAIDVLALETLRHDLEQGATIEAMEAPAQVRIGEPFEVAVTLRGSARVPIRVQLYDNGHLLAARDLLSPENERLRLSLSQRLESPGLHRYTSRIVRLEQRVSPQRESGTVVYAHGYTQVLYVTTHPTSSVLQAILTQHAFQVSHLSPERLPTVSTAFLPYDVIIFDNVPAHSLTSRQMQALADYVETLGGGFVMTGSFQSFGPGGYTNTLLERVLPVDMQVAARGERPPAAVVVLLDKSGSMAGDERGRTKIDIAKEALVSLQAVLEPTDAFGVIAFDRLPQALIELQPLHTLVNLPQQLQRLQAGGGTALYPALTLASQWLQSWPTPRRYVLLLSDGQTEAGDFAGLLHAFAESQIALSAVGIGVDVDRQFLQELTRRGSGRLYLPESLADVPSLFAREGSIMAGKWLREHPFTPRMQQQHEIVKDLETTTLPEMYGYVAVTPKELATVLLVADTQDPVLACWRFGLGKTSVWTSDSTSPWMSNWVEWEPFGRLWAQMVRWTSRRQSSEGLYPYMALKGDALHFALEALTSDGGLRNFLDIRVVMQDPEGKSQERHLSQTASGYYEALFDLQGQGAYIFHMLVTDPGVPDILEPSVPVGFYISVLPEYQSSHANLNLLHDLADMTQGTLLSREAPPGHLGTPTRLVVDIWPVMVTAALLLFIFESLVRQGVVLPTRHRNLFSRVESDHGT